MLSTPPSPVGTWADTGHVLTEADCPTAVEVGQGPFLDRVPLSYRLASYRSREQ